MKDEKFPIEIYVEDNSENANLFYKKKGKRKDVYVKYQNKYFKMSIISYTSLNRKLKKQYSHIKLYTIDANLIVVDRLNVEKIILSILDIVKTGYFKTIKECEIKDGNILYYSSETEDDTIFSFPISELKRIY